MYVQIVLRPVACQSPTSLEQQASAASNPLCQSVTAAGRTSLEPKPSNASTCTAAVARLGPQGPQPSSSDMYSSRLLSTRVPAIKAAAAGALAGELSCLSAEASRLSAVSMAVLTQQDAAKRSAALPAARRMALERQVITMIAVQQTYCLLHVGLPVCRLQVSQLCH